ncbi:MAG: adenosylmethionine--8-amino-7-oxononanoate transaminase, partial [Bermanella sp.]
MAQALTEQQILELDRQHVWHPYSAFDMPLAPFAVASADGVRLTLQDGRELIDGMSSWWSTLHGYNHPQLKAAAKAQIDTMAHVMFGGLTHEPAVTLCKTLVDITPPGLNKVFLSDSGSVACEVAIKMAFQYWISQGQKQKNTLITVRNGYHGDTFATMAVSDPTTGMHHMFNQVLAQHIFVEAPACLFDETFAEHHVSALKNTLKEKHGSIAAMIIEPIVQGTGGMRFYSPDYLKRVKALCEEFNVLLICDEIATGFGRTGKMFACEHADISPDILCVGKALTAGFMSMAATITTDKVAQGICAGEAGVFMHGPTFMANPLACAVANASLEILLNENWQAKVANLQRQLLKGLSPARELPQVAHVRVLGGIGVIELKEPVHMPSVQPMFVEEGVWVRPFGKLVYILPPFIMSDEDVALLTSAIVRVVTRI